MNNDVTFRRVATNQREIDESSVPESLRALIPYARRFANSGYEPNQFAFQRASQEEKDSFRLLFKEVHEELTIWLNENAQAGPPFTKEHVAFSSLRMLSEMEW